MDSLELNAAADGGTARAGARAATTIVNARMSATAPRTCARTRKAAIMAPIRVSWIEKTGSA
jgi:hypothetical protein